MKAVMQLSNCMHFDSSVGAGEKVNCANRTRWNGKKCKDEAVLIYEFDKRHRAFERMMQQNKGISGPM